MPARRCAALFFALLVSLWSQALSAGDLPDGWAVSDGPPPSQDAGPPGCCSVDARCCLRARDAKVQRTAPVIGEPIVVRLRELPHYDMPEPGPLPKDQGLIFYDGHGRPLSRLDVPPRGGEVRYVPRGEGGRIVIGDGRMLWGGDEPFLRGHAGNAFAFGLIFSWNARVPRRVPVFWHSLGDGGQRFRSARGTLDRLAGAVQAQAWVDTNLHVFADGLVRVFVSQRHGVETVHAIVPPGAVRYSSPEVRAEPSFGGFFFGREPFTELRLPLSSFGEASVGIDVSGFSMNRFRRVSGDLADPAFDGTIHLSVTRRADGGARLLIATSVSS